MSDKIIKRVELESKGEFSSTLRHKPIKEFCTLSHRILHYANAGVLRDKFMLEVSRILMDFSGCDAVELWAKEHNKYYSNEVSLRPQHHSSFGIIPLAQNESNLSISSSKNNLDLKLLCQAVIQDKFDHVNPFITKNGSFFIGNTQKSVNLRLRTNQQLQSCNFSNKDYLSLALIPIVVSKESVGILQLKSQQLDFFTEDEIETYEGIAQILGDALVTRHAQVALRERVKELTCLYGIAQLVERPDITLDEILQGIVELLPPAWLYSNIACARIIFDEYSHLSPNFHDTKQKLSADIVVDSEKRGVIEVAYTEEKPELDEGPFLKEERDLIDTIAKDIALIVEQRKIEEDKAKLQTQLRHADRLATIGQLAAGVAHELNEPLGNILGFAQLVKKTPEMPKTIEKDVDKIVIASLHAREVVKKLMLFARQMPPQKVQLNLNKLIEDGLYFLQSRCAKEGIELIRSFTPDLPEIIADPSQIQQVLVNLVVNAIQAMPKRGRLTIRTLTGDGYVSLIMEDTGIGMSEEVMKQIFTPFFTTKDIGQGTGLGLPVVHGIVTAHGGSIKVESKVGQGSRFEVKLPLSGYPDVEENDCNDN
jgi:signal transduction histidine kinase